MTDIVFLLLVFFLLTSPSITPQALDLLLPSSSGKTKTQGKVSVSISKEGDFYVNATQVTVEEMESAILAELSGKDSPSIILRADKTSEVGKSVMVMDIANKNKIQIVLATQPN
jgi:biopolymer transport protein ExbD